MQVIGLTGGIGMGKSTASKFLTDFGVKVVDTDVIARDVVQPGLPALEEIKARFGADVIASDGQLLREELGRRVFADEFARRDLEAILHPRIRAVWLDQVKRWRGAGEHIATIVIPLLFETAAEIHFTATVCVACSTTTQRARLEQRNWSREEIDRRNAAQWPVEKKMTAANFVIWTEGELTVHQEQWRRVLKNLQEASFDSPA